MKQYEYKIISPLFNAEKNLNELGFEGWELVAVDACSLYLKREIKV
ncbi:MAG: hypothetical protein K5893_03555 [Prevotella sp.]|nr:hypothetical protein [Prevotella sp.]